LAYINTLPNAFVFDDDPWILGSERIRSLANFGEMLTATNRPVLELTLALNYAVGGEDPAGYHLTNLVIHVLAALVLYGLVRRTLLLPKFVDRFRDTAPWLACAVAVLWLLHPLNTQSVTYTIQRGESLMGLCYLLTLYSCLRFATGKRSAETGDLTGGSTGGAARWALFGVAVCWVGMGTKEVMATAPLVVLLYDATFIARSWREVISRRWLFYAGLFSAWIPMAWFITMITSTGDDASAGFALEGKMLSRWTYLLSQPQVIVEVYLSKAFWPNPLVLDYAWTPAVPQDTPASEVTRLFMANVLWQGTLLVVLFLASIWGTIKRAWWGFLGLTFFLILAPTSSLMPIADLAVEHRMYLPLISVIVGIVFAGDALLRRVIPQKPGPAGVVLVALAALALGLTTVIRNMEYHSKVTVWDSVVVARPYNARGWYNLGSALVDEGRPDDALQCYGQALQIMPDNADAHYGIGTIWLEWGDTDKAIDYFQAAVRLDTDDAASHAHLGKAFLFAGKEGDAQASLLEAIRLNQDYALAHEYLGLLHIRRDEPDQAAASFREAVRADPRLVSAYQNLGAALFDAGRAAEAAGVADDVIRRADELRLSPEVLRGFIDRRDRYRAQVDLSPAGL
jgi:cytochrome c-type biogenesis protein CcmH/NrfG